MCFNMTAKKVTPTITRGVLAMDLPMNTLINIHSLALSRYLLNAEDYFTTISKPNGINIKITDGNECIATKLVVDFPGVSENLYVIVVDYGEDSEEGLIITILLPDEY